MLDNPLMANAYEEHQSHDSLALSLDSNISPLQFTVEPETLAPVTPHANNITNLTCRLNIEEHAHKLIEGLQSQQDDKAKCMRLNGEVYTSTDDADTSAQLESTPVHYADSLTSGVTWTNNRVMGAMGKVAELMKDELVMNGLKVFKKKPVVEGRLTDFSARQYDDGRQSTGYYQRVQTTDDEPDELIQERKPVLLEKSEYRIDTSGMRKYRNSESDLSNNSPVDYDAQGDIDRVLSNDVSGDDSNGGRGPNRSSGNNDQLQELSFPRKLLGSGDQVLASNSSNGERQMQVQLQRLASPSPTNNGISIFDHKGQKAPAPTVNYFMLANNARNIDLAHFDNRSDNNDYGQSLDSNDEYRGSKSLPEPITNPNYEFEGSSENDRVENKLETIRESRNESVDLQESRRPNERNVGNAHNPLESDYIAVMTNKDNSSGDNDQLPSDDQSSPQQQSPEFSPSLLASYNLPASFCPPSDILAELMRQSDNIDFGCRNFGLQPHINSLADSPDNSMLLMQRVERLNDSHRKRMYVAAIEKNEYSTDELMASLGCEDLEPAMLSILIAETMERIKRVSLKGLEEVGSVKSSENQDDYVIDSAERFCK